MTSRRLLLLSAAALLLIALFATLAVLIRPSPPPSIAKQMEALWLGKAHFEEVRDIDWSKPPYQAPNEGQGWFASPMPFPNGAWYLFDRERLTQTPAYCLERAVRIVVRESLDAGASWSNPAVVVATPGAADAPDACAVVDGSSYYDAATDTWQMLAQCLAAHHKGGWMLCHYVRHGVSPLGRFTPDATPAVRSGELWSQICAHAGGICDPRHTVDEGTPDIIFKKGGYFYVTFHGFDYSTKHGFRGVAKTADFHHWLTAGPDLPNAPIFAAPECQAWNPGCIGGGEASTLIAGGQQYMLIETPTISLGCTRGQSWPIALLRAPASIFPAWNSPLWQRYPRNPLLVTSRPGPEERCALQYQRWAIAGNAVYILYEDLGPAWPGRPVARRLLKLVPGGGPPVVLKVR
ncbi:MAG: sialidase family protein [Stellaceae bacterium]